MINQRTPRRSLVSASILALGLALVTSCNADSSGTEAGGEAETVEIALPEVLDLAALSARLEPSSSEKALLVNFWATW